jgi:hypothetical protein|tara:strand:+ start:18293 stop:18883 length:591 start_codon:yes stop_codon:yes gene_type:complete
MSPAPVAMTPAMIALLAKSRQVMNKSLTDNPIKNKNTQNVSESVEYDNRPIYNESDEREPNYNEYAPTESVSAPLQNYSAEHIMASNLPSNIKEAMIKNPIARAGTQGLSQDIINAINPTKSQPQPRQIVNEVKQTPTQNSDLITISRSELKELMNETLVNFLKSSYDKKITEAAISKTISTLIKEGIISGKKKTL